MFIAMDPPRHSAQRNTVSPIVSLHNLAQLEPIIRERAAKILDDLPIGQEFDWVDKVSTELSTMTLATLFDFPWEDRRKLTRWSNVATGTPEAGVYESTRSLSRLLYQALPGRAPRALARLARGAWARRRRKVEFFEGVDYFSRLWEERAKAPPRNDLISMLAHGESTKDMDRMEYLGNLLLLIVGGNDTTRNTLSGSILALNRNPDQYEKLRENPDLIPSMVSETIRWQTPLAYMRRTATRDFQLRDKVIRCGDKVLMWYVSGNRDEEEIAEPNRFNIQREQPRRHTSFGFGIHRCLGNRLAELQLRIIWEETLKRFPIVEVTAEPKRVFSSFVRGYDQMPVRIPTRNKVTT
jgi:cytochrome P450